MNIVIGRGNRRMVHELPGGSFMAEAAKATPKEYNALHANICMLANIQLHEHIDYASLKPELGAEFQARRLARQVATQPRKPIVEGKRRRKKAHS